MRLHPFETTQNPNAVEEIFCKEFENAKRVQMSNEESQLLISLYNSKPIPTTEVSVKDKFPLYQIIEKRVQHCFSFKITDSRVIVLLAVIAKSAGTAIMYLTYLQYKCKQKNIRDLTLNQFCEMFLYGFIPESELETIWRNQKVLRNEHHSDNLLDYQSAMQSIQFSPDVNE